jgi:hypothetical protein
MVAAPRTRRTACRSYRRSPSEDFPRTGRVRPSKDSRNCCSKHKARQRFRQKAGYGEPDEQVKRHVIAKAPHAALAIANAAHREAERRADESPHREGHQRRGRQHQPIEIAVHVENCGADVAAKPILAAREPLSSARRCPRYIPSASVSSRKYTPEVRTARSAKIAATAASTWFMFLIAPCLPQSCHSDQLSRRSDHLRGQLCGTKLTSDNLAPPIPANPTPSCPQGPQDLGYLWAYRGLQ